MKNKQRVTIECPMCRRPQDVWVGTSYHPRQTLCQCSVCGTQYAIDVQWKTETQISMLDWKPLK